MRRGEHVRTYDLSRIIGGNHALRGSAQNAELSAKSEAENNSSSVGPKRTLKSREYLVKDGRRIRSFEIPQNVVRGTIVHSAEKDGAEVVQYGSFSSAPTVIDLESYNSGTKTVSVSQEAGLDARGNTPCAPVLPYRALVFTDYYGDIFVRIQHSTTVCDGQFSSRWKNVLVQKDVQLPPAVKTGALKGVGW